jgi:AraC-like DNA-binding protein
MNSRSNESMITITINHEHLSAVVDILVKSKISFSVAPVQDTTSEIPPAKEADIVGIDDKDKLLIDKITKKYITEGIKKGLIPSVKEIAADNKLSVTILNRLFKRYYGQTFFQAYMNEKMEYAAQLLKKGLKCQTVAEYIGYGAVSSIKFNKMFQKHFGITPKKYQLNHRKMLALKIEQ